MPKQLKSLLQKLSLVGFGFLFAIILLEIVARQYHLVPVTLTNDYYDVRAAVGTYPEPYTHFWFNREDGERIWVQFNNASLRDIDHSYDKPPDTTRVLFLGDSYTAGWQAPVERTYIGQLRTLLDGEDYSLVSAGFHGWGTDRQYLYYRNEGYRYDSDVVILQIYVGNDVIDNGVAVFEPMNLDDGRPLRLRDLPDIRPYFMLDETGTLNYTPPRNLTATREENIGGVRSFLRHYFFTYTLLERIGTIFPSSNNSSSSSPSSPLVLDSQTEEIAIDLYAYSDESQLREDWATAWELTETLILALEEEVEANGAELRVLLIDTRWQHDPDGSGTYFESWDLPTDWTGEQLGLQMRALLERNDIPYIAPLQSLLNFTESTDVPITLPFDGHFSETGHCVVAVELNNWLVEEGVLPISNPILLAEELCIPD